jgi:hypothetical protein
VVSQSQSLEAPMASISFEVDHQPFLTVQPRC